MQIMKGFGLRTNSHTNTPIAQIQSECIVIYMHDADSSASVCV